MGKARTMRIIWFVMYLVAFILEFVGFLLAFTQKASPCVRYAEVGLEWSIAVQLTLAAAISDLIMAILGMLLKQLYENPYNGVSNTVIGVCCLIAALCLIIPLTYCGNPSQVCMLVGGVLVLFAGIVHGANAVYTFLVTGKDKTFND